MKQNLLEIFHCPSPKMQTPPKLKKKKQRKRISIQLGWYFVSKRWMIHFWSNIKTHFDPNQYITGIWNWTMHNKSGDIFQNLGLNKFTSTMRGGEGYSNLVINLPLFSKSAVLYSRKKINKDSNSTLDRHHSIKKIYFTLIHLTDKQRTKSQN